MRRYQVAAIPGDGIGPEVIPEAISVLEAVAAADGGFSADVKSLDWGSERYLETGSLMPDDWAAHLSGFDSILAGPIGDPRLPDSITIWGLILTIRQSFGQYVNLRPVRLLPGVESALRTTGSDEIDIVFVRENTEGEYSGVGGRVHTGRPIEVAVESAVFTRTGTERIIRYAFEYARSQGRRKVESVTKSNAQRHSMVFWDEIFEEVAAEYPDLDSGSRLVDAAAAALVTDPGSFDVVVTSNLFGDILTDLGAAVTGGLGIAPSANLDPAGDRPGLFQAIHGSAPDIAGRGIANPIGEIWSVVLMLRYLGEHAASELLERAMLEALSRPVNHTADLGGSASTADLGLAVRTALSPAREIS
jgi:tartrate dehydrogenase/decarboxylase/D-malate dehydrogenase